MYKGELINNWIDEKIHPITGLREWPIRMLAAKSDYQKKRRKIRKAKEEERLKKKLEEIKSNNYFG